MAEVQVGLLGCSRKTVRHMLSEKARTYEEAMQEQMQRIMELRDENAELRQKLEGFQAREKEISDALVEAKAQARRIVEEARQQAEEEVEEGRRTLRKVQAMAQCRMEALAELADQVSQYAQDFVMTTGGSCEQLEYIAQPVQEAPTLPARSAS